MVRLITLTLLLALISFVSAQTGTVINTPSGPITKGVTITLTWTTSAPATQPGILNVINKDTQNTTLISDKLDLSAMKLDWVVNVDPGTYNLALNDGSGNVFSGAFDVVAPQSAAPGKVPPKTPAAPAKGPAKEPSAKGPADPKGPAPPPAFLAYASEPSPNSSASTKSVFDLLLGLMTVAVIMVHSA